MPDTPYIVLWRDGVGGNWVEETLSTVTARSSEGAIRAFVSDHHGNKGGMYVAVPARSWKPVQVRAEQQVILKLEEAK